MMKPWIQRMLGITRSMGPTDEPAALDDAPAAAPLSSDVLLIDVRSPGEYSAGHIAGAISVPLDGIEFDITHIAPDKSTPMLLYCRSGARSHRACEILSSIGYGFARNGGGIGTLALQLGRGIQRT